MAGSTGPVFPLSRGPDGPGAFQAWVTFAGPWSLTLVMLQSHKDGHSSCTEGSRAGHSAKCIQCVHFNPHVNPMK